MEPKETAGEHIAKVFLGLFPSWETILTTILTFIVLMIVMYKLVWHPVRKMMEERRQFIQKNIDESIVQFEEARTKHEEAQLYLENFRSRAKENLSDAKMEAEKLKNEIIHNAQVRSQRIISEAEAEARKERHNMRAEMREEMVEIALLAAKKIIEKDVATPSNRELVKSFIDRELDNK